MKGIKGSITKLSNSIKSKLPDNDDLLGYAGIRRDLITFCLDESYGLLTELGLRKEKFEAVLLNSVAYRNARYLSCRLMLSVVV